MEALSALQREVKTLPECWVLNYLLEDGKADGPTLVEYVQRKGIPCSLASLIPLLDDLRNRGFIVCEKGASYKNATTLIDRWALANPPSTQAEIDDLHKKWKPQAWRSPDRPQSPPDESVNLDDTEFDEAAQLREIKSMSLSADLADLDEIAREERAYKRLQRAICAANWDDYEACARARHEYALEAQAIRGGQDDRIEFAEHRRFAVRALPWSNPDIKGFPAKACIEIVRQSDGMRWIYTKLDGRSESWRGWHDTDFYALERRYWGSGLLVGEDLTDDEWDAVGAALAEMDPKRYGPAKPDAQPSPEPAQAKATTPPKAESLEALTYCPGLVGEIVDFVVDTARKPNRVLALSAAITVIGRRIAGPTMSGTHLYVVTLAPTGAGKDHALDMATRLLHAAYAGCLVGPDEFMSQSAVIQSLERRPLSLCCMDEFGAFIKKMTSSKSHHEQNIGKTLRTAWNRSFAMMMTPQWAHSNKGDIGDSHPIYWPALSILGASTPTELFEAMKSRNVSNGFLNRFLVLASDKRVPQIKPKLMRDVPDYLAESLKSLFFWGGMTTSDQPWTAEDMGQRSPLQLAWGNGAEEAWKEFDATTLARLDNDPNLEQLIERQPEMAVRLATIRAVGRLGVVTTHVSLEDIEWGINVSRASGDLLVKEIADKISDDDLSYGGKVDKVLEIIMRFRRISRSDLLKKVNRIAKKRDLDEILDTLVESGTIHKDEVMPPTGGPSARFYSIKK